MYDIDKEKKFKIGFKRITLSEFVEVLLYREQQEIQRTGFLDDELAT